MILEMCCLYAGIGKRNHTDYLCDIISKHPTICFAHKLSFIGNSIIGKEVVQIFIATCERLAVIKNFLRNSCQQTLLVKYK